MKRTEEKTDEKTEMEKRKLSIDLLECNKQITRLSQYMSQALVFLEKKKSEFKEYKKNQNKIQKNIVIIHNTIKMIESNKLKMYDLENNR